MADPKVKKLSVTANDSGDARSGPVWHWMLNPTPIGAGDLPAWWSQPRDWYLREALHASFHDFWAAAVSIAVTKMASLAWEVGGQAPRLRTYAQQLLLAADGNQAWVSFLARHLQDFLCTDNGAFVEIVRSSSAAGSRIVGLMHLDSLRITRTGDPEIPALYRDTKGNEHELRAHQVLTFSDMPSASESWFGVGFCAASRAWGAILSMEAVERYIYEKVSGKRALAVDLVNGIGEGQMRQAVQSAEQDREGKGYVAYMGAVVVPMLSDVPITHTRINFAELPDGFDRKQEFDIAVLKMADAIGLDVQDLQPLTGQALGTGAQSQVLHDKSQGKGLAAWRQQFTHQMNQNVMPGAVTFAFSENDLRDRQQKADVSDKRVNTVGTMIDKGIATAAQGAQILADEGELPKEFVPVDETAGGALADTDQPEAEQDAEDARPAANGEPPAEEDATAKEAQPATGSPFRTTGIFEIEEYRKRFKALSR